MAQYWYGVYLSRDGVTFPLITAEHPVTYLSRVIAAERERESGVKTTCVTYYTQLPDNFDVDEVRQTITVVE